VLFALAYLLLRRVIWLTAGSSNEPLNTEVELVVLRHQLKVLKRQVGRPQLRRRDRVFMAAISRALPRARVVVVPREPADAPSVAPGARATEVDLPAAISGRQAPDPRCGSRAHPADGPGEPPMGLHQDPGRARQARHQGLGDEDPHAAAGERARARSPAKTVRVETIVLRTMYVLFAIHLGSRRVLTAHQEEHHDLSQREPGQPCRPSAGDGTGEFGVVGARFIMPGDASEGRFSLVEHRSFRGSSPPLFMCTLARTSSRSCPKAAGDSSSHRTSWTRSQAISSTSRATLWHTFWNATNEPARVLEVISL
jgi:hypothetical protein